MNYQPQEALTILLSGIVFGAAGYWVVPSQVKGIVVGAGAGVVTSSAYVQQNKRLRHLAAKQHQLLAQQQEIDASQQANIQKLSNIVTMTDQIVSGLAQSSSEHESKLSLLENNSSPAETGRAKAGQTKLNRKEINAMQHRLDSLENRIYALSTAQNGLPKSLSSVHREDNPDQEEDLQHEELSQGVIAWFTKRCIDVENSYQPDPVVDQFLDGLSLYLGENYSVLKLFHRRLKGSVGKRIRFNLQDQSETECSIHREYLQKLRESALLSFGRYFVKETKFILAATHNRKDVMGFLNGDWFERFIYYKTVEIFDAEGIDYEYLRNPMIAYSSENGSEIDLFFLVNNTPLLIECKSGQNYDEGIEKFVSHRQKLDLDCSRSIFVVLDLDEAQASLRTKQWGITVVNETAFIDCIRNLAQNESKRESLMEVDIEDHESDIDESDFISSDLSDSSSLEKFFKAQKLNLAPQYRQIVFSELIQLFEQPDTAMSFNEITKVIRDRLSEKSPLARHKIYEILNALRISNYLYNQYNNAERNVSKPISRVRKLDVSALEQKAMEYYAKQILQRCDPDFFNKDANIAEFEQRVLGAAPTPEKILEIKQR